MDRRIYLLALVAFIAGLDENIVGGILPLIARQPLPLYRYWQQLARA